MNRVGLTKAIAEAKRFLQVAQKALADVPEHGSYICGTKHTAATRRASMDLTRALAELRGKSTP